MVSDGIRYYYNSKTWMEEKNDVMVASTVTEKKKDEHNNNFNTAAGDRGWIRGIMTNIPRIIFLSN